MLKLRKEIGSSSISNDSLVLHLVRSQTILFWGKLFSSGFGNLANFPYLCTLKSEGEVLEWLKRHAWKACIPLKGITSSNLVLSAVCFMKFYQIRGMCWDTHPPFFLLGPTRRRAVPDWYTDYRQNPGGQSWLVPPGISLSLVVAEWSSWPW